MRRPMWRGKSSILLHWVLIFTLLMLPAAFPSLALSATFQEANGLILSADVQDEEKSNGMITSDSLSDEKEAEKSSFIANSEAVKSSTEEQATEEQATPSEESVSQGTQPKVDDEAENTVASAKNSGEETSKEETATADVDSNAVLTSTDEVTNSEAKSNSSTVTAVTANVLSTEATTQQTEGEKSSSSDAYASTHVNLYRLYNPNSGEHFYTSNFYEATSVATVGWRWEGIGWVAPTTSSMPVYRLYNPNAGDHHYTVNWNEMSYLVSLGWENEGIGWYSDDLDQTAVLRQYNPNAVAGAHNFTTSTVEDSMLASVGWKQEGIGWYATSGDVVPIDGSWLVTSAWGSLQRYWIDSRGAIATSRLVTTSEGAGYCAYATSDGSVVRGEWTDPSTKKTYLANNDGVLAPTIIASVSDAKAKTSQKIDSTIADNSVYLFFPGYITGLNTTLLVKNADSSATNVTIVGHGLSVSMSTSSASSLAPFMQLLNANGSVTFTLKWGLAAFPFDMMKSSVIDAFYVTSVDADKYGRAYVEASSDHTAKASVAVVVVDASGSVVYDKDDISKDKTSTIKGRGNSTWGIGDKKPYQVSLNKKSDLLETGNSDNANKKWILLANANDPTLLHNTLAYDMGLELGLAGCEGTPVDLYYDGEYRGTYYLCEKAEIKSGRVEITDLEDEIDDVNGDTDLDALSTAQSKNSYGYSYQYVQGVKDPSDITGGYLLELDRAWYKSEKCWFDTKYGIFVVKSPEVCSQKSMKYISEYVQQALNNLDAGKFNDGNSFDLDSFAKTYLVSEFMKNVDAFNTSTYFYKDKGASPIVAAPLWDFDGSMGTRTDWSNNALRKYEGFTLPSAAWARNNATIQARVRILYTTFQSLMSNVVLGNEDVVGAAGYLHSLAYYRNQIARSQKMNEVLYGVTSFGNEMTPFATYDLNVSYLKEWLAYRTEWWSANYQHLNGSSVPNPTSVYNGIDYSDVYDYYYYIANNPDVAAAFGGDETKTLEHFVTYGMREGRRASSNFDVWQYKALYPDLQLAFGNDMAAYYRHFITYGFKEGRLIA